MSDKYPKGVAMNKGLHFRMGQMHGQKRVKSVEQNFAPGRTGNPEMGGSQKEAGADNKASQQHDAANRTGSFEGRATMPEPEILDISNRGCLQPL
jgi:hypothetical protein